MMNYPQKRNRVKGLIYNHRYKSMIKYADVIIAISNFVKNDIERFYGRNLSDKIAVIPNAIKLEIDANLQLQGGKKYYQPYILCINSLTEHKNPMTLVKAFHILRELIPHKLVLLGAKGDQYEHIIAYINKNGLEERIVYLQKYLEDNERNTLIKNASLLVSPSLHEGFGRTPVEAAIAEIPVITSRETSLPETTLERVAYYHPATNENALAEIIMKIYTSPPSKDSLKKTANLFKENYSCSRVAQLYQDVFMKLFYN